jgi:hypothetical protein
MDRIEWSTGFERFQTKGKRMHIMTRFDKPSPQLRLVRMTKKNLALTGEFPGAKKTTMSQKRPLLGPWTDENSCFFRSPKSFPFEKPPKLPNGPRPFNFPAPSIAPGGQFQSIPSTF